MKPRADLTELYLAIAGAAYEQQLYERAEQWGQRAEGAAATESQRYRAKRVRLMARLSLGVPHDGSQQSFAALASEVLREAKERGDETSLMDLRAAISASWESAPEDLIAGREGADPE